MAFWALYKWFSRFRKRPYINYIYWYKRKLFNEWYESLTEEEKEEYQKNKKHKEELSKKRFLSTLAMMDMMYAQACARGSLYRL